jgi:hypothetical protein
LSSLTRDSLATAVSEVETLSPHLCTNPAVVDIKNKPAVSSVCQVEVPHVLESALINDPALGSGCGAAKGVATIRDRGHLVDDIEGQGQKSLL